MPNLVKFGKEKNMARILLCDDAQFTRSALRKILEGIGHSVVGEASNGNEVLTMYKVVKPDVVLMDIVMPGMDGITATKQIKQIDKNAIIIMVSSMGTQEKVVDAIMHGAKDFILKPFEAKTIEACLAKYVSV